MSRWLETCSFEVTTIDEVVGIIGHGEDRVVGTEVGAAMVRKTIVATLDILVEVDI